ncbi:MAG: hypothetical protein MPJ50_02225 [Pirellulales bacterium]|nr:hypothetical protein [Pirellulales bacterium]
MTLSQRCTGLLVVTAIFLTGCGNSPGGSSPDAAFNNFKTAVGNDDWETAIAQLTNESQDMMASGMVMMAAFASISFDEDEAKANEESFKSLLASHGLDKAELDDNASFASEDPTGGMSELMAPVKNKPAFIADLIKWIDERSDDDGGMMDEVINGQLKNVEVDGETAKGVIAMTKDGEANEEPVEFRKINGKWFIHLPMN